jgi:hypothetical protein
MDQYDILYRYLTGQSIIVPSPIGDKKEYESYNNWPIEELNQSDEFSNSIIEHMAELNRKVKKLTQEQFRIIQQLRGFRQVRITGCAGSGKTLVAIEKAIRLSEAGLNTLFLCHNPLLADHVERMTQGSGVGVKPFGEWVSILTGGSIRPLGMGWTNYEEPGDDLLAQAFDNVLEKGPYYDAIIVDEGQDFRDEWWALVEASLSNPKFGILYIFHDDKQALLPYRACYPINQPVFDLSRNCRNAGRVYEIMRSIHPGAPKPENDLRELGDVILFPYQKGAESAAIDKAVRWIFRPETVDSFIVLLSGAIDFEKSAFSRHTVTISDKINWQDEVRRKFERLISIYDSRGVMVPPEGFREVSAKLDALSNEPHPTLNDIELVRKVARSYKVHQDVRRRINNNPNFRDALKWGIRNGHLKLFRSFRAPLWAAEIILHFEKEDWHQGIPQPNYVCFRHHNDSSLDNSIPVYHVGNFKGLEADSVLLFMGGSALIPEHEIYVGISRARMLLALLVDSRNVMSLPPSFQQFKR